MAPASIEVWERPSNLRFPMVWANHEVQNKDGTISRFLVQDATPDKHDDIMNLLEEGFWNKEVICRSIQLSERDPKAKQEFWVPHFRHCLKQNVSLMVLEETEDGRLELVAAQILEVLATDKTTTTSDKTAFQFVPGCVGEVPLRVLTAMASLPAGQPRCPYYLSGVGLCVRPDRSGRNLATTILRTLPSFCAALGLNAYRATYTGPASQAAAKRAGFQDFGEIPYKGFKDDDGCPMFKDLDFSCKRMGFKLERDGREPLRTFDS